ncbi:MAG: hypothetical protein HZC04_00710 [Candidatus Lloydbacteria bacterium]|nr:hypothetical protein [Candidatus Lloydbacteria bacterium]
MAKNILQDVIASRKKGVTVMDTVARAAVEEHYGEQGFRKYAIWIVVAVAVLFLIIFSSFIVLSGATITLTPRSQDVSVDATFSAHKRALDSQVELPFDIMTIEETAEKAVPATGSETIHQKASGEIIVYNNYSAQTQKFVKNTRFETPDGKIYRVQKSIAVPGKTGSGTSAVPGSVVATVYADEEGDAFNIGLSDFTLPGLKGTPMFSGIYARSKTPMTGGFSGVRKIISDTDRQAAETELRKITQDKLTQRVHQEKPEGFVLYDDGVSIEFISDNKEGDTNAASNTVTMRMRAVLRGIMFNERDLSQYIAKKTVDNFDGGAVTVPNMASLRFVLLNKEKLSLSDAQSISFGLSGPARIVWSIDGDSLKEKLAGTPKSDFQKIMGSFLNIERAGVSIKPFWKTNFPENSQKIKVEIVTPASQ